MKINRGSSLSVFSGICERCGVLAARTETRENQPAMQSAECRRCGHEVALRPGRGLKTQTGKREDIPHDSFHPRQH